MLGGTRLECVVGTYFATSCCVCFSTLQERTFLTYLLVALLALAACVRERAIVDTSEDTHRLWAHVALAMSVASVVPLIVLPSSSSSSSSSSSCSSSSLEIACVSSIGLRIGAQASRVSVKCESVGSSRALAVCGLGKSDLREWREGSGGGGGGRRRPRGRRRRSGLFGMEDGGGIVVHCDGISGGERGEMMAERNAHHDVAVQEGLGAFSTEGYELTPALIVEEDRESTHTDSPVLNRLKEGFVRFKEEKFL